MEFTLSWLKTHLDTDCDLDGITDTMTAIGLEVEGVINPAADLEGLVTARIDAANPHPNADRLKLCTVNDGTDEWQVVCGADNAVEGLITAFAKPGSYIPAWDDLLKESEIRGVTSHGMLCSADELNLPADNSDDNNDGADGIMALDPDLTPGMDLASALGLDDPVIDMALTPNRADCAGVRGIARDLAAAGIGSLTPFPDTDINGDHAPKISLAIDLPDDASDACPMFLTREIDGLTNGQAPDSMARRLAATGKTHKTPKSALVDITNYMMLDLNRPMHAYDRDKITGDLVIRLARDGESFVDLQGNEHDLTGDMTVITDDTGVIGLAGIIGGQSTAVDDDTTSILLECAHFDPIRTRKTVQSLNLHTDAGYRFERGVDPTMAEQSMDVAVQHILGTCSGSPSKLTTAGAVPDYSQTIEFDPDYTTKITGVEIPVDDQLSILDSLGIQVNRSAEKFIAHPPASRPDITQSADLIEEILRIHGYDKLPSPRPLIAAKAGVTIPIKHHRLNTAAKVLAARGLTQTVTWAFCDTQSAEQFQGGQDKLVQIANPISNDLSVMRPSILPHLIAGIRDNANRGQGHGNLFETGATYAGLSPADQETEIAIIRSGTCHPNQWSTNSREVDFYDIKSDVMAVLDELGAPTNTPPLTRDIPGYYHPGRAAAIQLGPHRLAQFGGLHPSVMADYDIDFPVVMAEIYPMHIPGRPEASGPHKGSLSISPYQPVTRDFAFILDAGQPADSVINLIQSVDRDLIERVDIFDLYAGENLGAGEKSLACRVRMQPTKDTMTDDEIDAVSDQIIQKVTDKLDATLRSA